MTEKQCITYFIVQVFFKKLCSEYTFLDNFAPIMKYMGDYPSSKQIRKSTDLTDVIFEPPLLNVSNMISTICKEIITKCDRSLRIVLNVTGAYEYKRNLRIG